MFTGSVSGAVDGAASVGTRVSTVEVVVGSGLYTDCSNSNSNSRIRIYNCQQLLWVSILGQSHSQVVAVAVLSIINVH